MPVNLAIASYITALMPTDTCILFFSRSSPSEQQYKSFAPGQQQNQRIIEQMIQHSQQTIKATGLPYWMSTEADQQGNSFGSRLAHSLSSIFDKGYQRVLIVGNDCLQLQSRDLLHAAKAMRNGQQVIGPTRDGGAYLIGISQEAFERETFEQLPWESADLYEALGHYFHQKEVGFEELRPLSDIDNQADLSSLLPKLRPLGWLRKIITALKLSRIITFISTAIPTTPLLRVHRLRGPPILF
ncbi:MAG: DUF2064 domain-containing protein [Bacteroidota bacterium]